MPGVNPETGPRKQFKGWPFAQGRDCEYLPKGVRSLRAFEGKVAREVVEKGAR